MTGDLWFRQIEILKVAEASERGQNPRPRRGGETVSDARPALET
jgi:hypothetical protein